jgi:CDP-glucose 4,6-dehydratase
MEQSKSSMENMVINKQFWKNKSVFLTGHTGFKGSWLALWLQSMGANLVGFALNPNTEKNIYEIANVQDDMNSVIGDIQDYELLESVMKNAEPQIIFHLAAQPLVRESYINPIETYQTNLMGTLNLLNISREIPSVKSIVNITTDKCYKNNEWVWSYREDEPMGGHDPYSSSKACSEIATSSFRRSFFNTHDYSNHGVGIATARAGNVVGGGDWSKDRLLPDIISAYENSQKLIIRNPESTRPWQHVLEPLYGYIMLAEKLYFEGDKYSEAWNFGPESTHAISVLNLIERLNKILPNKVNWEIDNNSHPHEANLLSLDIAKAKNRLNWRPVLSLDETIQLIIDWHLNHKAKKNMKEATLSQIERYELYKNNQN